MKKKKTAGNNLPPADLCLDDLEDLHAIISEGGGDVEIEAEDYTLDGVDEFAKLKDQINSAQLESSVWRAEMRISRCHTRDGSGIFAETRTAL
ncbi:MAG: hypothetical protein U5K38_14300 [Woeseiaceae bacterium]|nr:hypothetical protein [Woeseiaceae bacterium]